MLRNQQMKQEQNLRKKSIDGERIIQFGTSQPGKGRAWALPTARARATQAGVENMGRPAVSRGPSQGRRLPTAAQVGVTKGGGAQAGARPLREAPELMERLLIFAVESQLPYRTVLQQMKEEGQNLGGIEPYMFEIVEEVIKKAQKMNITDYRQPLMWFWEMRREKQQQQQRSSKYAMTSTETKVVNKSELYKQLLVFALDRQLTFDDAMEQMRAQEFNVEGLSPEALECLEIEINFARGVGLRSHQEYLDYGEYQKYESCIAHEMTREADVLNRQDDAWWPNCMINPGRLPIEDTTARPTAQGTAAGLTAQGTTARPAPVTGARPTARPSPYTSARPTAQGTGARPTSQSTGARYTAPVTGARPTAAQNLPLGGRAAVPNNDDANGRQIISYLNRDEDFYGQIFAYALKNGKTLYEASNLKRLENPLIPAQIDHRILSKYEPALSVARAKNITTIEELATVWDRGEDKEGQPLRLQDFASGVPWWPMSQARGGTYAGAQPKRVDQKTTGFQNPQNRGASKQSARNLNQPNNNDNAVLEKWPHVQVVYKYAVENQVTLDEAFYEITRTGYSFPANFDRDDLKPMEGAVNAARELGFRSVEELNAFWSTDDRSAQTVKEMNGRRRLRLQDFGTLTQNPSQNAGGIYGLGGVHSTRSEPGIGTIRGRVNAPGSPNLGGDGSNSTNQFQTSLCSAKLATASLGVANVSSRGANASPDVSAVSPGIAGVSTAYAGVSPEGAGVSPGSTAVSPGLNISPIGSTNLCVPSSLSGTKGAAPISACPEANQSVSPNNAAVSSPSANQGAISASPKPSDRYQKVSSQSAGISTNLPQSPFLDMPPVVAEGEVKPTAKSKFVSPYPTFVPVQQPDIPVDNPPRDFKQSKGTFFFPDSDETNPRFYDEQIRQDLNYRYGCAYSLQNTRYFSDDPSRLGENLSSIGSASAGSNNLGEMGLFTPISGSSTGSLQCSPSRSPGVQPTPAASPGSPGYKSSGAAEGTTARSSIGVVMKGSPGMSPLISVGRSSTRSEGNGTAAITGVIDEERDKFLPGNGDPTKRTRTSFSFVSPDGSKVTTVDELVEETVTRKLYRSVGALGDNQQMRDTVLNENREEAPLVSQEELTSRKPGSIHQKIHGIDGPVDNNQTNEQLHQIPSCLDNIEETGIVTPEDLRTRRPRSIRQHFVRCRTGTQSSGGAAPHADTDAAGLLFGDVKPDADEIANRKPMMIRVTDENQNPQPAWGPQQKPANVPPKEVAKRNPCLVQVNDENRDAAAAQSSNSENNQPNLSITASEIASKRPLYFRGDNQDPFVNPTSASPEEIEKRQPHEIIMNLDDDDDPDHQDQHSYIDEDRVERELNPHEVIMKPEDAEKPARQHSVPREGAQTPKSARKILRARRQAEKGVPPEPVWKSERKRKLSSEASSSRDNKGRKTSLSNSESSLRRPRKKSKPNQTHEELIELPDVANKPQAKAKRETKRVDSEPTHDPEPNKALEDRKTRKTRQKSADGVRIMRCPRPNPSLKQPKIETKPKIPTVPILAVAPPPQQAAVETGPIPKRKRTTTPKGKTRQAGNVKPNQATADLRVDDRVIPLTKVCHLPECHEDCIKDCKFRQAFTENKRDFVDVGFTF